MGARNESKVTMTREIDELIRTGVKWWPSELVSKVSRNSPSLLLKSTQSEFFDALVSLSPQPERIRKSLTSVHLPFNVFLKHLLVLADFGGERVKRVHADRKVLFKKPDNSFGLAARFEGVDYEFGLRSFLATNSIGNSRLGLDGARLIEKIPANDLSLDLALVILLGYFSLDADATESLAGCDLIQFVGAPEQLRAFVSQRYLDVSRISQGATANSLGQALQIEVLTRLKRLLGTAYTISSNDLQLVGGRRLTSDLMVVKNGKKVAIEIAFQQTTNSVIERKATEAPQRKHDLNSLDIASCFVIDGIGNFERRSALEKIAADCDLVVNFSDEHIERLADFCRKWCK